MDYRTKCNLAFCKYFTKSGCMVGKNTKYCRKAIEERYQYMNSLKEKKYTSINTKGF